MRRREFITLLGGAAAAWPLAAWAQQPGSPIVGFYERPRTGGFRYWSMPSALAWRRAASSRVRTSRSNFAGHAVNIDRLPALAADLVRRRVNVLVAIGGDPSPIAAKQATSSIPIVFGMGGDPIKAGLVQSFNRPGGNVTGVSILTNQLEAKRFGLLRELVPGLPLMGVLINKDFRPSAVQLEEVENAARTVNQKIVVATASNDEELAAAFEKLIAAHVGALLVAAAPYFDTRRDRIVNFAADQRLPAIYQFREYASAGGLLSYGVSLTDGYRQFGTYAASILNGANPATLPFNNPSSSNWCSTSRPQERSNLNSRRPCSLRPTRSSNETEGVHHAARRRGWRGRWRRARNRLERPSILAW